MAEDLTIAPTISVITVYHNRHLGIEDSVFSILNQTHDSFEYIIIDDASTDDTSNTLSKLSHPRLRVVRNEKNIGLTRSLNKAISISRGSLVAIHGAGDISHPTRLEKQSLFLNNNPTYVVVGVRFSNRNVELNTYTNVTLGNDIHRSNIYSHGEVMFRRNIFEKVGGYNDLFYFAQDRDLWLRMALHGNLGHIEEYLYERRIYKDGVSIDPIKQMAQYVFSNLAVQSSTDRANSAPDRSTQRHALAIIEQFPTHVFRIRSQMLVFALLKKGHWASARDAMSIVPIGMLSKKQQCILIILRFIFSRSHRVRY
jgi:glycosyltransferase involved in cell wall biosynthesis